MNKDTAGGFMTGLLVGAILGAALGLLYAPQTGKETRRMVKEKAVQAKGRISDMARRVKTAVTEDGGKESE